MNIVKIVIILLVSAMSGYFAPVVSAEINEKDSVKQVVEVMAMALNSPQVSGGLTVGKITDWSVKAKGVDLECRLTVKDPSFDIDALSDEQWQQLADEMEESLIRVMGSYSTESDERLRLMRSVHTKFHFRFTDSYGNKGEVTIPL